MRSRTAPRSPSTAGFRRGRCRPRRWRLSPGARRRKTRLDTDAIPCRAARRWARSRWIVFRSSIRRTLRSWRENTNTSACAAGPLDILPTMRIRNLLSLPHWKSRLLLWGAAAGVGVAAVTFAGLADAAQTALRHLVGVSPWWPWLLAPLGFFAIAWITQRYFRGAEGSGIPQTIFALRPHAGAVGDAFLKPSVAIGRVVLAALGLLCGGSIGREGPTVQ